MWFSIIKSKLLVKPKTQLRVQDNKEVEDDEPCKRKLEEYVNFFKKQKNYNIHNDPEIINILEEYEFKPLKENHTAYGKWDVFHVGGFDKTELWENNDIVTFVRLNYHGDYHENRWKDVPEKVACKALDMIDNADINMMSEKNAFQNKKMDVGENWYYIHTQGLIGERDGVVEFWMEIFSKEGWIYEFSLYQKNINKRLEEVYPDKETSRREWRQSIGYVTKLWDIFYKKASPKNWR